MIRCLLFIVCILSCLTLHASGGSGIRPMDLIKAREYCDSTSLHPVEGIWEYPEDGLTTLVRRLPASGHYELVVIESDDTRVSPGEVIGTMQSSADPGVFRLTLATRGLSQNFGAPMECLATLSKDGTAIYVKARKHTIKLSPAWILPRFWRIARIQTSDPLEKLPAGMIRLYPSTDGDGTNLGEPRYL